MNIRYRIDLTADERDELTKLLSGGKCSARKLKRAQVLLAADAGAGDEAIERTIGASGSTIYRTKRRFVEAGLEAALSEETHPGAERKLSGKEEALLIATACSKPPAGRARWTLELLAGEFVKLTEHESLSRETVRRRLAENQLKPWRKDMWCIPEVNAEYVARMEDVLDLYAEEPDPKRPVVCFDESPTQLVGEVREPIPAKPGQLERFDCEYRRNGTANLFIFLDAHRSWRKVKVTDRRAAQDFATCMRELSDVHFPKAEKIRIVLDNLSTHSPSALYQTSRRRKPDASYVGSSSITPQGTQAGSIWSRSRSASCELNVSTAESTTANASKKKSKPGSVLEIKAAPPSSGCSHPKKPAPKWQGPTQIQPMSHNPCAEVLAARRRNGLPRPISSSRRRSGASSACR